MKAVHFGAGNIGKGLIGLLLQESGFEVTLADIDYQNTQKIHSQGFYLVQVLGESSPRSIPADALCTLQEQGALYAAIEDADLITTSVGASNLGNIAQFLLKGLLGRFAKGGKPLDIIANENMINASSLLKDEILKIATPKEQDQILSMAGFPNSAIDRLALSTGYGGVSIPLVEPYAEWIINRSEIKAEASHKIRGASYVDSMAYYIERKLYCVNANHAAGAYLGFVNHFTYIHEAFRSKEITAVIGGMHKEIALYFLEAYGTDLNSHQAYIEKTILRHSNPKIDDEITRVGRSPLRKLSSNERLIAPFKQLSQRGALRKNLAKVIAAALCFSPPQDEEAMVLQERIKTLGIEQTLVQTCGLTKKEDISLIAQEYSRIRS